MDDAAALRALTGARLAAAVDELTARDADLAGIVERFGSPPLWDREPGFPTLLHIILEQQVSLSSAQAAFDRLRASADPLSPATFLALSDEDLLRIGFSRQKARYGRALAAAVHDGSLDLDGPRTASTTRQSTRRSRRFPGSVRGPRRSTC